jgi:hypothetical protein
LKAKIVFFDNLLFSVENIGFLKLRNPEVLLPNGL